MKNPTVIPSLQKLITQRTKERGLNRSQLVQSIGYTNISKGIRRSDTYLRTLKAPSEEFVVKLLTVLEITGLQFLQALNVTQGAIEADEEAQEMFKPHLEILVPLTTCLSHHMFYNPLTQV
jgi:hypothetical protein